MEWYSSSGVEDLSVPTHEEIFDRLPSPVSRSSWNSMVGNFNCSPEELTVLDVEELLFSGTAFSSEVEHHNAPSVCQGFSHASHQQKAYPCEHSDFQLNDFAVIDEADDIFFHALFKDASEIDEVDQSANYAQTSSKDDLMSVLNLSGQRNHIQDCANNVESVCPFLPPNFAKKTRICFRDSLYRLAENSRHQIGKGALRNCRPSPSRQMLGEVKAKKSDTNTIDRTVATLLFTFPTASTSNLIEEVSEAKSCSNQPNSPISSVCIVPGGDAEVPTFCSTNKPLPPRPRSHSQFSTAYVMQT
ncbi:hypothetical protein Sango_0161300 [Sesamum angolense]|uniref:Uncharacterized protein n=1 Tax=Sesamum angolense TaxID=2727404 RepID=A0AAE2C6K1_9LAMI|nr:hypothetical protein Sango_0161300 [Sesamum angolense]